MKWLDTKKQTVQSNSFGRRLVILIPYLWLLILFLIPFIIIFKISFSIPEIAVPPYDPLIAYDSDLNQLSIFIYFTNYRELFDQFSLSLLYELNPINFIVKISHSDHLYQFLHQHHLITNGPNIYLKTYLSSIYYALITTFICLLMGYPVAYAITKAPIKFRNTLFLLVILPFWTSFLLRIYAWMMLLSTNGILNQCLKNITVYLSKLFGTSITIGPLDVFYNEFSLVLVLVYTYLPFMILPLYMQLAKIDHQLIEAATDLGAQHIKSFTQITWPLSRSGVVSGSVLVFIPVVGEYVIPELVAGSDNLMIGEVLWQTFFNQNNWPLACAIAIMMVTILIVPVIVRHHAISKRQTKESR